MENKKQDEDNFEFLAADDPLMAKLQLEYAQQLIDQEAQLELDLKEIVAKKKKIQKEKQETGVRLYSAQQQLAENQMDYQKAHDNYNIIQKLRIQAQQKLAQINEGYGVKKQESVTLKSKVTKAQKQLENLMKHYHQIGTYNIQLKSDIAVTRTETFTAQKNVGTMEYVKKKQDVLIDSMNEEIKRLQEQKNIIAAQLVSQKEETQQAKKVLKDAQLEMGKIIASKKNLLQRWQKSLNVMQKMDQTLQSLKDSHKEQAEANILIVTEINGVKAETRKQEARTEKATNHANRLTNEKNSLDIKKGQLKSNQDKVLQQLALLQNSLNNTQQEIKKTDAEKKQIDDSMNLIETNIMKLHTETKRLLEELINQKGQHTAIEKTASNLLKQARQISLEIEEKQVQLQNLLNEIARVRIDQLNTKSQIELLQTKKQQIIKERVDKEVLVATYEIQIRQGHDLNEKKQHQVGRLNKLHDQLVSNANDQTKSPLENKLINLKRETEVMEKDCNELYRDWIKKQTVLVHENNKLQELEDTVASLQTKKTILQQKKARLNSNYKGFEKEITTIQINLKNLQNDMNKLNDGLAVNGEKKKKLQNQNVNIESEFGQKLKDLERDSVQLEVSIDSLRENKAELLNEIIECERQILLWERKYQLEKQMQETLDPNVGQSEIEELKKEIHRMELKYDSIKKAQEQIITQMNRAANKKVAIQIKYTKKPELEQVKKDPENSNQLQKVIQVAKTNYAKTVKTSSQIDRTLEKKKEELQKISGAIEENNDKYSKAENDTNELSKNILMAKTEKLISVMKVSALQARYKKYDELMNKTAKLSYQEPVLRSKLDEITQKNNTIYAVLDELGQKFPQYHQILESINQISRIN